MYLLTWHQPILSVRSPHNMVVLARVVLFVVAASIARLPLNNW